MSNYNKLLRGLLIYSPILVVTVFAVFGTFAQTTGGPVPAPIQTGSTQQMANYTSYPSGVNALEAPAVPPLIMLVVSRDEQLFNKAYPDYTDLNGDGTIDTTYQNAFAYNGYFDPLLCYSYSGTSFAAASTATNHQCPTGSNTWSGNFMNWVSMSRLDIVRWVLYGGTRSTDLANNTVLERAEIPDDLHAWAKVYSGSDINLYTPLTGTQTFCNVSTGTTGNWGGASSIASGITSTPVIRTASGNWADWATTAKLQCQWNGVGEGDSNRPSRSSVGSVDRIARITVCQNSSGVPNESYCVATGSSLKPEGLLQKYSTQSPSTQKRFGLITGSWTTPRLGGQVRRNVGQLNFNTVGTACATGDEFDNTNGTFCYKQAATKGVPSPTEGIVMTLDRLQIIGWNGGDYGSSGFSPTRCDAPNDSTPWGGRAYDIQANPTKCPDFGNPLAGMYAEALRYIQGESGPKYSDSNSALPTPAWVDPYGTPSSSSTQRNASCAACSIVLISSGLNSFDYAANVPTVTGLDNAALTNAIQSNEGISGNYLLSTYYNSSSLLGAPANGSLTAAGTNYSDISICSPATIGTLSGLTGICLGTPGQEGTYAIAGLSYGAWSTSIRTKNVVSNFKVKTYGISLSENLPSFSIPVTSTQSVQLSPTCRGDPARVGTYASCYIPLVALGARKNQSGNTTYGLTPTSAYPNVGSYYLVWEDSQYGSDHDQDATNVISYCVGSSCNMPSLVTSGGVAICDPIVVNGATTTNTGTQGNACNANGTLKNTVAATDVLIRNQWIGYSSGGMYIGYQLSGTTNNAVTEFSDVYVNFGCNMLADNVCNSKPQVTQFSLGTGAAVNTLQPPLWYAAKYSAYSGAAPSLPAGLDPPNYFFARNAGALKDQLDSVFQSVTSAAANNFGNATTPSSSNDVAGNGFAYQVQYFQQRNGVKWTGSLQSFWSDSNGFLREGSYTGGNEVLSSSANYVVTGPDRSTGAVAGALTNYRCSVAPVPAAGTTTFDPSTSGSCSAVSATNLLQPAWDAATLLNAYYDPTTTAGASAIVNLATQRAYAADASATGNIGQRYIFTYLTSKPNGSSGTGTVVGGTQTDFVWNDSSCNSLLGTGIFSSYTLSATSGFCGNYVSVAGILNTTLRYGNFGLLNEKSATLAKSLVNWVRGVEDPTNTYRSRTNNFTTGQSTYRLGDIIDSSPAIVGTPSESYDLLYSDSSYAAFRSNYRNRRQMVYVGANDGMLHAFNSGFYVPGQASSGTPPTVYRQLPAGLTTGYHDSTGNTQGNNWALGQEAWAFIPENLLPHLRWLADKAYTHVFYVDGAPVVSDVQIFGGGTTSTCQSGTPAATDIDQGTGHVCGWGTVIVVPFRLGGGPISVDAVGDGAAGSIQSSNSAYVILDVTNPEIPPKVLGEITTGTYTLGRPAFAVHRESDGLHFLLTIGSGPVDNGGPSSTALPLVSAPSASTSYLGVWVYDLSNFIAGTPTSTPVASFTGYTDLAGSFAGDMIASDFDLNYSSEAVYFGVVTNPPAATKNVPNPPQLFSGSLWKVNLNTGATASPDTSQPGTWTLVNVLKSSPPITVRPSVALDPSGRPMVYFGSGRSYTKDDDSGTSAQGIQQQYIYGVSDNNLLTSLPLACQSAATFGTLFNASAATVSSSGTVSNLPAGTLPSGNTGSITIGDLQTILMAKSTSGANSGCYQYSGWEIALAPGNAGASDGTNAQQPSERVVSDQTLFNNILLTPTYIPPNKAQIAASGASDCNPVPVAGTSNLYALNYLTGTADPSLSSTFGGTSVVPKSISLGSGKASSPVLHVGSNGTVSAAFGIGGGTTLQSISTLPASFTGEISWREPVDKQ